jgi:hypothetical protein
MPGWTVGGSNPVDGETFRTVSGRLWGLLILLYNGYPFISGGKAVGSGVNHQHPSNTEVKKRVELSLYSSSVPSWPVLG